MLRTALRPRFLGLLALMVVATIVCGLLAGWQWDRAHRALTSNEAAPSELGDVREVLDVGDPITNRIVGDIVTATGEYDPGEQVLVGGRHIEGTEAAVVVTALHLELEDGSLARLPVARGWLPSEDVTDADGELDPSLAPAPPSGRVEVTGRLEAGESASAGIEDGVSAEIATTMLINEWGSPMYGGYIGQTSPAEGLSPMPEAESEFSRNLDWQNIGYSAQWVLFGGFFLYLWWRSVRTAHLDEQADQREALQAQLEHASASTGDAPAQDGSAGTGAPGAGPAADGHRDPPAASAPASPVAAGRAGPTRDKDV